MALINQEWLDANSNRSYPLHDRATRRADSGAILSNAFLTDAHLYLPASVGKTVFLAAAQVSPNLVSLLLAACDENFCTSSITGAPYTIIGELSLVRPVVPGRNYSVNPLVAGVAGWVCFGKAVQTETFGLKFSSPDQSLFLDRCVYMESAPVVSMGKQNVQTLEGLIRFSGKPGSLTVTPKTMKVNGVDTQVIAIGVDPEGGTELLEALAGACGHRPGALTCNKRVIESINGVTPDCNGNVDLEFLGGIIVGEDPSGGLILDYPLGLHDVCAAISPSLVGPADVCGSMAPVPDPVAPSDTPWPPGPSSSDSGLPPWYCEDFAAPPSELTVMEGVFDLSAGRWRTNPAGAVSTAIDLYATRVLGYPALVTCTIRPESTGEGHIVLAYDYGYVNISGVDVLKSSYIFVGVDLVRSRFFIAKRTDTVPDSYEVLTGWTQASLPVDDYVFSVMVEPLGGDELITINVVWSTGSFTDTYLVTLPSLLSYGRYAGIGATSRLKYPSDSVKIWGDKTAKYSGYVLFDDFGIDCNGSSSFSS